MNIIEKNELTGDSKVVTVSDEVNHHAIEIENKTLTYRNKWAIDTDIKLRPDIVQALDKISSYISSYLGSEYLPDEADGYSIQNALHHLRALSENLYGVWGYK